MATGVETSPRHNVGGLMPRDLDVEASVRAIYDAQSWRLVGWATTLMGDPDLADDFATETVVKLMCHWCSRWV